jgi:hypothetical protein
MAQSGGADAVFERGGGGDELDQQTVHEILSNGRRRKALEELERRVEPVELRDLAERIAEVETDESPPPRNARQSVYNSLRQTHLPKLDDMGVVDYDPDRKTISLRDPARQVDLYMEVVTPYGITWTQYYRTLGVIALSSIAAANTGVVGFAGLPTLGLTTFFLTVFVLSTGYQLWSRRWFYLRSVFSAD